MAGGGRQQRLGEIVQFLGLVSRSELEGALTRQAEDGGRLGTCLLDSGRIDEESLLAVLGAQQKVETVAATALGAVTDAVAALLPARVAVLTGAVPLGRRDGVLEVAMMEPRSLALLDILAFTTRLRVLPRLALELRIAEAQERLYDVDVREPLARTRRRLARRRDARAAGHEPASAA